MSNDELFPVEAVTQLSPRLAWMKRHRIHTRESLIAFKPGCFWQAWIERVRDELPGEINSAVGATEHDAMADLALRFDIELWNEEGA